jgi:hypothetical protein
VSEGDVVSVEKPPLSYPAEKGKLYYIAVSIFEVHGYSGPISDTIIIGNLLASSI